MGRVVSCGLYVVGGYLGDLRGGRGDGVEGLIHLVVGQVLYILLQERKWKRRKEGKGGLWIVHRWLVFGFEG